MLADVHFKKSHALQHDFFLLTFNKVEAGDCSVVKNTCSSCKRPEFSACTHNRQLTTACNSSSMG